MAAKLFLVSLLLLQIAAIGFAQKGGPAPTGKAEPGGPAGGIPKKDPGPAYKEENPKTAEATPAAGGAGGKKWCVAKQSTPKKVLKAEFEKLCKIIDCSPTEGKGMCYDESHKSKATFAMNTLYQKNGQKDSDCNYGGIAEIVTKDPSWGKCILHSN